MFRNFRRWDLKSLSWTPYLFFVLRKIFSSSLARNWFLFAPHFVINFQSYFFALPCFLVLVCLLALFFFIKNLPSFLHQKEKIKKTAIQNTLSLFLPNLIVLLNRISLSIPVDFFPRTLKNLPIFIWKLPYSEEKRKSCLLSFLLTCTLYGGSFLGRFGIMCKRWRLREILDPFAEGGD